MQEIIILGPSGSGKSTLSNILEEKLQIPCYHLDKLFWQNGWVASTKPELNKKVLEIIQYNNSWILDGIYAGTADLRIEAADTIIYLDFPRRIYFPRIFTRYLHNIGKTRPDMAEGCNEKLDYTFISFVWNFKKHSKPRIDALLDQYRDTKNIITLRTPKDVRIFLNNLKSFA